MIRATRNTHVYDASCRALCMRVGRAEQLYTAGLVGAIVHCWFSGSQKNNTWLVALSFLKATTYSKEHPCAALLVLGLWDDWDRKWNSVAHMLVLHLQGAL